MDRTMIAGISVYRVERPCEACGKEGLNLLDDLAEIIGVLCQQCLEEMVISAKSAGCTFGGKRPASGPEGELRSENVPACRCRQARSKPPKWYWWNLCVGKTKRIRVFRDFGEKVCNNEMEKRLV
jgi:hypothetical protein